MLRLTKASAIARASRRESPLPGTPDLPASLQFHRTAQGLQRAIEPAVVGQSKREVDSVELVGELINDFEGDVEHILDQ